MGLKAWVKAPGAPSPLADGHSQDIHIGTLLVRLTAQSGLTLHDRLGDRWRRLESVADASLFLSWPWIGSWLQEVVGQRQAISIEIFRTGELIALALATLFERRLLGKTSRVAFLHELPLAGHNMVVEKNGVLASRGEESPAFSAAVTALAQSDFDIDEIRCSALDERYLDESLLRSRFALLPEESATCWLLGKAESPLTSGDLLGTFSGNRRSQIGRFQRRVEKERGPLLVTVASSESQAWDFFERLEALHTRYWRAQGMPGSFSNPRWKAFHWALICELLPTGRLHLAKVSAGDEELGYLYNIGHGTVMSNIQSGFSYRDDNRWRPGYLSHLLAAEVAARQGYAQYDLLMGDEGYKASIARPGVRLHWFSLFPRGAGLLRNRRYWLRQLLECYRRVRTSSKPNAQGDSRS
jgi:hypothetical protein